MKLLFADGTAGFSPARLAEKATGGILSSLTILPRLLARRGFEVYVKSTHNTSETIEGVHYLSPTDEMKACDLVVFNRNVLTHSLIDQAESAGAKVVWWLHDVVDPRYLEDDGFTRVKNIVSLSDYCTRTYSEFFKIPTDRFTRIPNGVDKSKFYPGDYANRNPNLFIYASAPIKGLKALGFTAANLKRHNPNAELRLYTSQGMHEKIDDALVKYQLNLITHEGGTVLPPIPQDELAKVMREAWCLLMPNSYPEICSNLLLQAKASGLPVVATPTGSIPEFYRGVEITDSSPLDLYFWWAEFAGKALGLIEDKARHEALSLAGPVGVMSWDEIADQWAAYLRGLN